MNIIKGEKKDMLRKFFGFFLLFWFVLVIISFLFLHIPWNFPQRVSRTFTENARIIYDPDGQPDVIFQAFSEGTGIENELNGRPDRIFQAFSEGTGIENELNGRPDRIFQAFSEGTGIENELNGQPDRSFQPIKEVSASEKKAFPLLPFAQLGLFLFTALSCSGLGATLAKSLKIPVRIGISTALGALLISLILGLATVFSSLSCALVFPVLIPGFLLFFRASFSLPQAPQNTMEKIALFSLLFTIIPALIMALLPVDTWDAQSYHLPTARFFIRGHFGDADFQSSARPHYATMFYLLPVHFGLESSARLIELFFTFSAILCLVEAKGPGGWLAGGIFSSPLLWIAGTSATADGLLFLFSGAILYFLFAILRDEPNKSINFLICSALAGGAAGTKYIGLYIPVSLLFLLFLPSLRAKLMPEKKVLFFSFLAVCFIASPWLIRNKLVFDNPFFPHGKSLFGGFAQEDDIALELPTVWDRYGFGHDIFSLFRLPWDLSVRAQFHSPEFSLKYFDGILSPLPLALLPFLFFTGKIPLEIRALLWLSLLAFVLFATKSPVARFSLPFFLFSSPIIAFILERVGNKQFWLDKTSEKKSSPAFVKRVYPFMIPIFLFTPLWMISKAFSLNPLPVILGKESKNQYLQQRVPPFLAYAYLMENPPEEKILPLLEERVYYLDLPVFYDAISPFNWVIPLNEGPDAFYEKLRALNIKTIVISEMNQWVMKNLLASNKDNWTPFVEKYCEKVFDDGKKGGYQILAVGKSEASY